ncbi:MAG TPA: M48 family metalloprotease [Gemmatimonadaceae bacterium]|nr:M48 family metalloprotease [Gemmatimonadaceae bacterium]
MTQTTGRTDSPGLAPQRAGAGSIPVPGPIDRVHFLDEQHRYRKASRRFSVLAFVAVMITSAPACVVVTPLVFTVLLTVWHIVNAVSPVSAAALTRLRESALLIPGMTAATGSDQAPAAQIARMVLAIVVLVLPGALAIFALWLANRRLLRHVAIGHALEQTGSRAPNERDLEERQLRNVVEEMAIAAGLQPPRLRIIDSDVVNAAAVGVGVDDATVLVTRGLLDKLDRDETQAVVGHVVGSIGNGDLKIVSIIFSIYQTWGALALLVNAPFAASSRRAIWRGFRTAFRGQERTVDRWEAEFVSDAFLRGVTDLEDAEVGKRLASNRKGLAGKWDTIVMFLSLPSTMIAYVVRFAVFISSMALIGPIVAFMWRTRRHLADAMAVQLTRNPDALARALRHFGTVQCLVPQGEPVSLLFFTWPPHASAKDAAVGEFGRMHPKLPQRERRLLALGADPSGARPVTGLRAAIGDFVSAFRHTRFTPYTALLAFAFFVLVPILFVAGIAAGLIVLFFMTGFTLMVMMVVMVVVAQVLNLLFVTIPGWIWK